MRTSIPLSLRLFAASLLLVPFASQSEIDLELTALDVLSEALQAREVTIGIEITPEGAAANIEAERLVLFEQEIFAVRIRCARWGWNARALQCAGLKGSARWNEERVELTGDMQVSETGITGTLRIGNELLPEPILVLQTKDQIRVVIASVALAPLADRLKLGLVISGALTAELVFDGSSWSGSWSVREFAFDTANGRYASSALAFAGSGTMEPGETSRVDAELWIDDGQLLLGDLYTDFSELDQVRLELAGSYDEGDVRGAVTLQIGDTVYFKAQHVVYEDGLQHAEIDWRADDLTDVLRAGLGSFASARGVPIDALSGSASGAMVIRDGSLKRLAVRTKAVNVVLRDDRLHATGLDTDLVWNATSADLAEIAWQELALLGLPIDAAELQFILRRDGLALARPARLPILDGALSIAAFELSQPVGAAPVIDFRGSLEPVSLPVLSDLLGWPSLQGTLAGDFPGIRMRDNVLSLDGEMLLALFAGQVRIGDMQVERLFGAAPSLAANIVFEGIDLEQLTSVLDFGRITGTLEGHVLGLRLINWQPVAFDLLLRNPTKDPRKHRISQQAVEVISSIGGAAAALSSTFLRIFDQFRYDRLGMQCILRDDVCLIDGIDRPAGGYFLVKGSGLPRVDIIGYAHRIDFPDLLARVQAALQTGTPRVE